MIRRPPRSTLDRSSAASDVYKRQEVGPAGRQIEVDLAGGVSAVDEGQDAGGAGAGADRGYWSVSYTHLRAHETVLDLVCRLLLEKRKHNND